MKVEQVVGGEQIREFVPAEHIGGQNVLMPSRARNNRHGKNLLGRERRNLKTTVTIPKTDTLRGHFSTRSATIGQLSAGKNFFRPLPTVFSGDGPESVSTNPRQCK
ncbi:MAG: hypothetical protein EBZ59_00405 [Planctomycetia bacterium]|nr:hypothetical protein [Planctomycetia bacterium]